MDTLDAPKNTTTVRKHLDANDKEKPSDLKIILCDHHGFPFRSSFDQKFFANKATYKEFIAKYHDSKYEEFPMLDAVKANQKNPFDHAFFIHPLSAVKLEELDDLVLHTMLDYMQDTHGLFVYAGPATGKTTWADWTGEKHKAREAAKHEEFKKARAETFADIQKVLSKRGYYNKPHAGGETDGEMVDNDGEDGERDAKTVAVHPAGGEDPNKLSPEDEYGMEPVAQTPLPSHSPSPKPAESLTGTAEAPEPTDHNDSPESTSTSSSDRKLDALTEDLETPTIPVGFEHSFPISAPEADSQDQIPDPVNQQNTMPEVLLSTQEEAPPKAIRQSAGRANAEDHHAAVATSTFTKAPAVVPESTVSEPIQAETLPAIKGLHPDPVGTNASREPTAVEEETAHSSAQAVPFPTPPPPMRDQVENDESSGTATAEAMPYQGPTDAEGKEAKPWLGDRSKSMGVLLLLLVMGSLFANIGMLVLVSWCLSADEAFFWGGR